jgi:uncharacterized protein (DUF58 family)
VTDLDARYGRRPPLRPAARGALIVSGVLLLVALAVIITTWYLRAQPDASLEVRGYTVVSDTTTTASVDVSKPRDRAVACEVRALDKGMALVGTSRVVATGAGKRVRVDVTIPTTARAFGVRAGDCVLE